MMETWLAPRQSSEAAPVTATGPRRAVPATPESTVARAKLQPTVYLPSGTADHRHAA